MQTGEILEPAAKAFERFGPAGAAVLGILCAIGIFAWLALRLSGAWVRVQEVYSQRLREIAEAAHRAHDQAQERYTDSLDRTLASHERETDQLREILNEKVASGQRVEALLQRLLDRFPARGETS